MTPTERANKIMDLIVLDENTWDVDRRIIADAIRSAESDSLERAAVEIEANGCIPADKCRCILTVRSAAAAIRALKEEP